LWIDCNYELPSIIVLMTVLLVFVGLGVGVLLNALADDLPPEALGQRRMPGPPRCRYCGAAHAPRYWLALASLLFHGGRCEHCGGPRRFRSGVVEAATAFSLAYLWGWAGGQAFKFLAAAVIAAIFFLITIIDLEHRLILWMVVYPAAVIVGLIGVLSPGGWQKTLLGGGVGFGLVWGMYLLGGLFSRVMAAVRDQSLEEVAFGWGDVNLALVIGLTVGWSGVLFAVLIAIFTAGAFSVGYLVVQRLRGRYTPFMAIPYGPFLVLGALTIYLYGKEIAAAYAGR
jgi:prepilin signal peptidase PulO-like enzyme (type II secretory pathway)